MDRNASVLIRVFLSLSCDGDKLVGQGLSRLDVAALVDDCRISKDEVDGAGDVALTVELTVGVRIKGVLEGTERAPVEYREVGP